MTHQYNSYEGKPLKLAPLSPACCTLCYVTLLCHSSIFVFFILSFLHLRPFTLRLEWKENKNNKIPSVLAVRSMYVREFRILPRGINWRRCGAMIPRQYRHPGYDVGFTEINAQGRLKCNRIKKK